MKLLRLELFGFKSFLNRTVFHFNEGITSLVGPNGCGKSNIVDAFVWVLGERGTKSLRVKDMGDVIFHGSNGKRPVNMAEVTLDLSDGQGEYSVRRRIFRDGVNEYFLNGSPVRLKDVHEFFLGTGIGPNSYAIVEQGRIEHFIHMKPVERRLLIEEASGITRFEEKKREAVMRLEETRVNLERVEDLFLEVEKNCASAAQEWERWKAYRELSLSLTAIECHLLVDGYKKISRRMEKTEERLRDIETKIRNKDDEIALLKEQRSAKAKEYELMDGVLRNLEIDVKGREKELEGKIREIGYVEDGLKRNRSETDRLTGELKTLGDKIARAEGEARSLRERIETMTATLAGDDGVVRGLEERLEGLSARRKECGDRLDRERTALFVAAAAVSDVRNRIRESERQAAERKRRQERQAAELMTLGERLTALGAREDRLRKENETARAELSGAMAGEKDLRDQADMQRREAERTRQTIERLKGEKTGKEAFLAETGKGSPQRRPVLQGAKKLIELIPSSADEEGEGAARFFVNEMDYYVVPEESTGRIPEIVGRYNDNLIFFSPRGFFLPGDRGVVIRSMKVDSVDEALRRIDDGEEGLFVAGGVCIDSRGFIMASTQERSRIFKRLKDRVRLEKEIGALAVSIEVEGKRAKEASLKLDDLMRKLRVLNERKNGAEKIVRTHERDLAALEAEKRGVNERIRALKEDNDPLYDQNGPDGGVLIGELSEREKEKEAVETRMARLKAEADDAEAGYGQCHAEWHGATLERERKKNLLQSTEAGLARHGELHQALMAEMESRSAQIKVLVNETDRLVSKKAILEGEWADVSKQGEKNQKRLDEVRAAVEEIHGGKRESENAIGGAEKEREMMLLQRQGALAELEGHGEKIRIITERLSDVYNVTDPNGMTVPPQTQLDRDKERIEKEIRALGEVNFRAEKEYGDLKDRLAFLRKQKDDLSGSAESLKKTISRIEGLSQDMFLETFERVASFFKDVSSRLFKGGRGHLSLLPDSGGIELFVQPPGKRVTRMDLLSGGEKALISLSFLLSLMETRPSPFSLLDEIDAPLDDANLVGLLDVIKDMSRQTQIVIITHNRITMGSSHTIYGITMEEEGISKTISVRL